MHEVLAGEKKKEVGGLDSFNKIVVGKSTLFPYVQAKSVERAQSRAKIARAQTPTRSEHKPTEESVLLNQDFPQGHEAINNHASDHQISYQNENDFVLMPKENSPGRKVNLRKDMAPYSRDNQSLIAIKRNRQARQGSVRNRSLPHELTNNERSLVSKSREMAPLLIPNHRKKLNQSTEIFRSQVRR